jgi:hypothetical protein
LLLLGSFHKTAEEGASAVESGSHRANRASHDFGDLLVAVLLDIGEDQDLTLLG